MKEQVPQSPFDALLRNIYLHLSESHFEECLTLFQEPGDFTQYETIQIKSLHAYVLTMNKQYSSAMQLLEEVLQKHPYHHTSKKRKAVLLEKMGKIHQSKIEFQKCLFLQPESRSLKNKLKRLNMSSSISEGFSSDSKQSSNFQEKQEVQEVQKITSIVKFGNFEVIEFNTEDSDEHFAMIKQEISKLSEKKPKKSILKESMSASVFKEKKPKVQTAAASAITDPEISSFKASVQKVYTLGTEKKKKKAKSVSFKGDTNLEDVQ